MSRLIPLPGDLFKQVDRTVESVDAVLVRVEGTLGTVGATLTEVEGTLSTVSGTLAEATAVLGEVRDLLAGLAGRLELLDQVPALAAQMAEIHRAVVPAAAPGRRPTKRAAAAS